jgi:hypothetical protein
VDICLCSCYFVQIGNNGFERKFAKIPCELVDKQECPTLGTFVVSKTSFSSHEITDACWDIIFPSVEECEHILFFCCSVKHDYGDWNEKNPKLVTCNPTTKITPGSHTPQEVKPDQYVVFSYDVTFVVLLFSLIYFQSFLYLHMLL